MGGGDPRGYPCCPGKESHFDVKTFVSTAPLTPFVSKAAPPPICSPQCQLALPALATGPPIRRHPLQEDSHVQTLAAEFEFDQYLPGQTIYAFGSDADSMYILLQGQVALTPTGH